MGNHMASWFDITLLEVVGIVFSTLLIYIALIGLIRLYGVRSFARVTGHDFAILVAIGAMLAGVVLTAFPGIVQGILAIACLLGWKKLFSYLRFKGVEARFNPSPILIMQHGEIFDDQLQRVNLTRKDLFGKLREANVVSLAQVHAVIVEESGDISVLHGAAENYNDEMLHGVTYELPDKQISTLYPAR